MAIVPLVEVSRIAPASAQFAGFLSFWQRRPERPLGTRGICLRSPGLLENDFTVVSDRPLFSWQGKAVKLNVMDYDTKEIVWTTDLDPQTQQIVYSNANPLVLGKRYRWQVLGQDPSSTDMAHWSTFEIMAVPQRDEVLAKLKEIEQKAQQKKASPEAIAEQQATYLLDQNLWSDALQVLHTVKNPSSEFAQNRKEFMANLCPKTTANQAQ
jgi:hypothetical protein